MGCGDLAVADRRVDRPVTRQWIIERGGHPSGAEIEKIRRKRAAEPPSFAPTNQRSSPICMPAESTARRRSGTRPSAEINKVPGIASPSNSLNSESLPEMNGIR